MHRLERIASPVPSTALAPLASRTPTRRLIPIAFFLAALTPVAAQALELDECKSLEDDAKRLACYDTVSGRVAPPQAKELPKVVEGVKNDVSGIGLSADRTSTSPVPGTKPSSLSERWDLDAGPDPGLFSLRPYKPVYILPAFYSTSPNRRPSSPNPDNNTELRAPVDHLEGKFQFSLKTKVWDNLLVDKGSLWFGYTQSSRWQLYNREASRPFRETTYEPELMYTAPLRLSAFGIDARMIGLSIDHQSNGRDLPLSRSWNRVIGQLAFEAGNWTTLVRPWLRIREKADRDDNPDILDYVGRGEVIVIRKLGNQQVAVTLRHTLRSGQKNRGSLAVEWSFPIYGHLKGYVQAFSGYGESLIDYNHRQNSIGVGVSLLEWL